MIDCWFHVCIMFVLVSHYVRMNNNRELGDFPIKLDGLGLVTSIQSIHVFIRVRDFEDFFSFSCDEFFPNLRWVRLKEPGCGREILRDPGDPGWVLVWRPPKNWSNSLLHPFFGAAQLLVMPAVSLDSILQYRHLLCQLLGKICQPKMITTCPSYLWESHHQRWIRNLHAKLLWTKKKLGGWNCAEKNLAKVRGKSILKRDGMWIVTKRRWSFCFRMVWWYFPGILVFDGVQYFIIWVILLVNHLIMFSHELSWRMKVPASHS